MTNVEKTGNELKNVVIVRGGGDRSVLFLEELNIFWKYICRKNFQSDVVLMVPDS